MHCRWRFTDSLQLFSIVNEIGNNSHFRTTSVVMASVGVTAFIYILVAITGYLSFGNTVPGNVVSVCKFTFCAPDEWQWTDSVRRPFSQLYHRQSRHRRPRYVLLPPPSPSLPRLG